MNLSSAVLILSIIIYFIFVLSYFRTYSKKKEALQNISKEEFKMYSWESWILEKTAVDKSFYRPLAYIMRFISVAIFLVATYFTGAIAFILASCFVIALINGRMTASLIERAGVEHIELLNAFLDSYVPSIASGNSSDSSMLKYINQSNDEDLLEWWVSKDDENVKIPNKWKRIIDVYSISKHNESIGVGNSLDIIREMQKDINTKQEYYNSYSEKMGEVQPIVFAYYIFVPLILGMSFYQVPEFWFSFWGYVAGFGMIVLFSISQFMVYKIRESSTNVIF